MGVKIKKEDMPGRHKWMSLHYAVLLLMCFFLLAPIFVMFQTSFKVETQIFSVPPVWIFFPTIQNYIDVLVMDRFGRYLTNSLIVGVFSTLFTLTFGGETA